ncbi:MAG: SPASM domain-containing protein [Lachnospiraceae bacterium]|nr:SPASM domain-containing protein [Lachnospiraceae bacterium]
MTMNSSGLLETDNMTFHHNSKPIGILGFGDGSEKLIEDFRYIFSDILNLGDAIRLNGVLTAVPFIQDLFICCTYERAEALRELKRSGLIYKRDFLFAEDCFPMLDDWKKCKIIFRSYHGSVKEYIKAVVFGYAAKHGKILPNDPCRDLLQGYYDKDTANSSNRIFRWITYSYYLLSGILESIPQLFAKRDSYDDCDHICFYDVSDATRFIKDHPSVRDKVITTEELKSHTMASLYMRAVYFDKRQNGCNCETPFHTLYVGKDGMTRLCDCPEFLDVGYGNIGITDINDIWNSTLAKIIRLSMINNTYTFCSRALCGKLKSSSDHTGSPDPMLYVAEKDCPDTVIVANDTICNLHCPSCRKSIYVKNPETVESAVRSCTQALLGSGWLEKADTLIIGGNGETFLSNNYKQLLYDGIIKRNNIVIMTNGTLFTQQEWRRLKDKYENISFSVSIDAATRKTYEKIRCGGNYEKLMKNMELLSALRKNNKVASVRVNMIVQKSNYKEIPDFIAWAKRMGFDEVNLSHIRNWGTFSEKEFSDVSMFDENEKMKPDLVKVLRDPICKDPIVRMQWKG